MHKIYVTGGPVIIHASNRFKKKKKKRLKKLHGCAKRRILSQSHFISSYEHLAFAKYEFFSCITEHVCVRLFYPCAPLTVRHMGGKQGHDLPREKDSHHHLPNLATKMAQQTLNLATQTAAHSWAVVWSSLVAVHLLVWAALLRTVTFLPSSFVRKCAVLLSPNISSF